LGAILLKHSATFPFIIALLAALFFGAATPVSKTLLTQLTTFQLAGLLYLGAAGGVIFLLLREGKFMLPWQMDRQNAFRLAGAIFFGGVIGPIALLWGLEQASAASVSMWLNLEVVATAVLGHFLFRDYLTRRSWLATGGVFLAAGILALGDGIAGIQAGLLVTIACVCWGIDNHLTALIDGITPAQSTFWKGLVAGSTNLAIGISLVPIQAASTSVVSALAVGAVSYGLSIVFYITAAQHLGATRSQLIFSSAPFLGVLLSISFLREPFTLIQGVAAILFLISMLVLFREQHQHHHKHANIYHDHLHIHNDDHHLHQHPGNLDKLRHSHQHNHDAFAHGHPHWPDLHHRHDHN
jgi:drug/metabolite transporter (DMT)-like permease